MAGIGGGKERKGLKEKWEMRKGNRRDTKGTYREKEEGGGGERRGGSK